MTYHWTCKECGRTEHVSPHTCLGEKFGQGCGCSRTAIKFLPKADYQRVMREYHQAYGGTR
jgi:hypothetical protein